MPKSPLAVLVATMMLSLTAMPSARAQGRTTMGSTVMAGSADSLFAEFVAFLKTQGDSAPALDRGRRTVQTKVPGVDEPVAFAFEPRRDSTRITARGTRGGMSALIMGLGVVHDWIKARRASNSVLPTAAALPAQASPPPLTLSHTWIVVTTGAPERSALERAGFRIAPAVNRHEGQGTASVTVELLNGFLELIYPDSTVPVSPALRAGAEKFRLKSAWRTSGYSPIGIVFDRTPATPDSFPFATWKISADWMQPGTFIEILTPRDMGTAVSLSVSSQSATQREQETEALARDSVGGAMFRHPNGARRLTGLRVVAPNRDHYPPAAAYLAGHHLVTFDVGSEWLLDVTLDNGKQGVTKDLRPELPLVIHY